MHVFFKLSGLFLFALAIVFAGNGVFELQNAGILLTTNLAWLGRGFPWAGLYPNLQVVSVQGLLLAGAILAWVVIPRASLATAAPGAARHRPDRQDKAESPDGRVDMLRRWAGPIVVVLILGGVIAVLALNLNLKGRNVRVPDRSRAIPLNRPRPRQPRSLPDSRSRVSRPDFREYPIGDEVEKNEMLIKAVWLPPVQMEGMEDTGVVRR